ncbi:2'-5'-oligoadenylate synthase 1A-like [Antedon mediterranea]|uniref:2'-5'-oligoadenylate synthase 1A-like n=1 Tax=Antedon mediterranea TaxID=105859 RepID=UPI003AF9702D
MLWNMDFVDKNCVDLDRFIVEALIPSDAHLDAFRHRIDGLIEFLKNKTALKIRRVVKGGSLERGTSLKGRTNCEVILFLDDFRSVQDMKAKMSEILAKIERRMKSMENVRNIERDSTQSIAFEVLVEGSWFCVRINPSYDISSRSQSDFGLNVYNDIATNLELREYCSTALNEHRLNLIKSLPDKVKNLMRLLHHWNLHICERHDVAKLSDYIIESIVLWCWKRAGSNADFDISRGMKTVMSELTKGNDINIDWHGMFEEVDSNCSRKQKHPELPLVLDPVDPTMNMCEPVNSGQNKQFWQKISHYATDTNNQPILRNVAGWIC